MSSRVGTSGNAAERFLAVTASRAQLALLDQVDVIAEGGADDRRVAKIGNELRNKRPEHYVDKWSLADIHDSLARAANVLTTVKARRRGAVAKLFDR
jgi:hypothetical protein